MKIVSRVTRDRHAPAFRGMLKLSMTTYRCYKIPTIFCKELEDITNFHGPIICDLI
jgi:hypothetical protein